MSLEPETIAVVTLTRKRPHLLGRAIASVAAQTCSAMVQQHLIAIDDCVKTRRLLEGIIGLPASVSWLFFPRCPADCSGPRRSAVIRNSCVQRLDQSTWISFLDDDNEFEPEHLESLWLCARESGCRAVYSWLQMFQIDGRPFIEPRDPWTRDSEQARAVYKRMVERGVRSPGSNIFRDRADSLNTPDPVRSVDTSTWLLRRDLLVEMPIPEDYSQADWDSMTTEDDKFLAKLIETGEPIRCSRRATLRYYLGGYSNTRQLP